MKLLLAMSCMGGFMLMNSTIIRTTDELCSCNLKYDLYEHGA